MAIGNAEKQAFKTENNIIMQIKLLVVMRVSSDPRMLEFEWPLLALETETRTLNIFVLAKKGSRCHPENFKIRLSLFFSFESSRMFIFSLNDADV